MRKIIEPQIGDLVKVKIQKLRCTGIGTFQGYDEFVSANGTVTLPVVRVTSLDGTGLSYIWESTIKNGGVNMVVNNKDILAIM